MKPEVIKVTLYDDSRGIGGRQPGMPCNAQQLIVWLQGHLAKVPEEHRDGVEIDYWSETDITTTMEYYRYQTPEEMEAAEKKKAADIAIQEQLDRAEFEQLKRRFEP